jgi:hypothetical protein
MVFGIVCDTYRRDIEEALGMLIAFCFPYIGALSVIGATEIFLSGRTTGRGCVCGMASAEAASEAEIIGSPTSDFIASIPSAFLRLRLFRPYHALIHLRVLSGPTK